MRKSKEANTCRGSHQASPQPAPGGIELLDVCRRVGNVFPPIERNGRAVEIEGPRIDEDGVDANRLRRGDVIVWNAES